MRRVALIRGVLAAALATGLTGCGGSGDDDAGRVDSSPSPEALTVSVPSLPGTLDPALARTAGERAVAAAINTPLLTYRRSTDTDAATLEPALATDLPTLSDDASEYRFVLRPGLLYADGRVVTASDVERSIAHASVAAADPELRAVLDGIVGAPSKDGETLPGVVTDDRSGAVVVKLRRPDGRMPFALADPATAPLPALPAKDPKALPSSTGPLRVARVSDASVELVANPLRARISTVPAARATQVSITDRRPTSKALVAGTLDLVVDPAAGPVADQTTRVDESSGAIWALMLPPRGALAARPVRQAIADAIDRRGVAAAADPTAATTPASGSESRADAGSGSSGSSTTPGATSTTPSVRVPHASGSSTADEDIDGGLVPACGLLPAYVVGAVVRDDCPPSPSIAKASPLLGQTIRLAVAGDDLADVELVQVVAAAVASLGGSVQAVRVNDPAARAAGTGPSVDAAIVRAAPNLPHPAGWLEGAAAVDDLVRREVVADQAGPLTGSSRKWSALEQRAVQRAVMVPLAVGRSAVLIGPDIARSSVLLHPVLGLDLTALQAR